MNEYTAPQFDPAGLLMPRLTIELPGHRDFTTRVTVAIGDINYGGHLGNDAVLRLAQEARIRFLATFNASELDVEGRGIIMADAAVMYRAEAFHGNELDIHVAVADLNRSGCDFLYQLVRVSDGREIARVKTGIVFFDYAARKVARVPEGFAHRFASAGIQTDENLSAQ